MARIYRYPNYQWFQVMELATGVQGWARQLSGGYFYFDGRQTERDYYEADAKVALKAVRIDGKPVFESYERCQEITALQYGLHRD